MSLPFVGGARAGPPSASPSFASQSQNFEGSNSAPPASPQQGQQMSLSPRNTKEVDYYLNPTELFRWINYRRWDGARARAQSHPDECDTWIVSRHSSDGRVLWRHLPLHLVCMQREAASVVDEADDPNTTASARQIEALIDVLLDSYPEGASSPDDQGMLPLHLLLAKAEREPNERVINLLLTSFPNAVDVQDKFGRTPYDILREQTKDGSSDRWRAAFRALKRARFVADRITATIRDESANIVAAVKTESTNERDASQKIIVRLEEELANVRKQLDEHSTRFRNEKEETLKIKQQLMSVEGKSKNSSMNLEVIRKERDELMSHNDELRHLIEGHDEEVDIARREAARNRQGDLEMIANLKSEVSTCKAMSEALESQLRSRFTNEEFLSTSVTELEEQLSEMKVRLEHANKKSQHELEAMTADNTRLKWNITELTKKNASYQSKQNELSKQMANVLSSHSSMTSEHDRIMDVTERQESDLLDAVRSERAQLTESMQKQRRALESALLEQERILEVSLSKEEKLVTDAKQERMRGKSVIEKLRKEFHEIRNAAVDRERQKHAELAANRKIKGQSSSSSTVSPVPPEPRIAPSFQQQRARATPRTPNTNNYQTPDSSEGHLVRLLDERAALNAPPHDKRRGNNISQFSPSSSGSLNNDDARRVGPPQYIGHQPENMMSNNNTAYNPNAIPHDRSPMIPQNTSSGGGRNSANPRIYDERSDQSKLAAAYSLDEYSQGSDSSNGGTYSDGSSGYERRERHERQAPSNNGRHSAGGAHYQDGGGSMPRRNNRHEFNRDIDRDGREREGRDRANLSYISESYGDESTIE